MYFSVKPRTLSLCHCVYLQDGSNDGAGAAATAQQRNSAAAQQEQCNSAAAQPQQRSSAAEQQKQRSSAAAQKWEDGGKGWGLKGLTGLKKKADWTSPEDAALAVVALSMCGETDIVRSELRPAITGLRESFERQTKVVLKARNISNPSPVDHNMDVLQKSAVRLMNPPQPIRDLGREEGARDFSVCLDGIIAADRCVYKDVSIEFEEESYDAKADIDTNKLIQDQHIIPADTQVACFAFKQSTGPELGYEAVMTGRKKKKRKQVLHAGGLGVALDAVIGTPETQLRLVAVVFKDKSKHVTVAVREISTGKWWHCDDADGYIYNRTRPEKLGMTRFNLTHLVYRRIAKS